MLLPNLIDTQTLQTHINHPALLIIDLCSNESYAQGHIPHAVNVPPARLSCGIQPATGKLPSLKELQVLFASIGLTKDKHVVVYDDAGGCWAGRMIWTLTLLGYESSSFLDGGMAAWRQSGYFVSQELPKKIDTSLFSPLSLALDNRYIADMGEIIQNLTNPNYAIWDARTLEEYNGSKVLSRRSGHIPGAAHLEWSNLTNADNNNCIRPLKQIQAELDALGLSKDKTIVTYCQTHRRSGLTWFVAHKLLGYPTIKAYPGSWSEWGSHSETPIES